MNVKSIEGIIPDQNYYSELNTKIQEKASEKAVIVRKNYWKVIFRVIVLAALFAGVGCSSIFLPHYIWSMWYTYIAVFAVAITLLCLWLSASALMDDIHPFSKSQINKDYNNWARTILSREKELYEADFLRLLFNGEINSIVLTKDEHENKFHLLYSYLSKEKGFGTDILHFYVISVKNGDRSYFSFQDKTLFLEDVNEAESMYYINFKQPQLKNKEMSQKDLVLKENYRTQTSPKEEYAGKYMPNMEGYSFQN